jgi:hypothetical protein
MLLGYPKIDSIYVASKKRQRPISGSTMLPLTQALAPRDECAT